ncbi:hypothetical protein EXIGLDRAFT_335070 [Exidia glandulosa HHB12029]|uniref:Uncharacterized protein n=1 Tax=Exidia glandulosa HHB12029 TaxID=1314781 RepID=A0A165ZHI5_EXIGL|nr:hypothetical protein EXIGLDRAFT_335070 [Exidia glandulosa HHB12029]
MSSTHHSLLRRDTGVPYDAYDPTGGQTTPAGGPWTPGYSDGQDVNSAHAQIDDATPLRGPPSNVYLHPAYPPRKFKSVIVFPRADETSGIDIKQAWKSAMPSLVEAYIQWRTDMAATKSDHVMYEAQDDVISASAAAPAPSQWVVVDVVAEKEYMSQVHIPVKDGDSVLVALVRAGVFPCYPSNPKLAVSIDVLDMLFRIKRHESRATTLAFAAVLCDRYMRRTSFGFWLQICVAESAFSMLMREVKRQLDASARASRPPQPGFLRRVWGSIRRSATPGGVREAL